MFTSLRAEVPANIDEKAFATRPLMPAESAAIRGDFLVRTRRPQEARAMLTEALKQDPDCPLAHEGMGLLLFQQGQHEEASKWLAQAVRIDSKDYLTHYLLAMLLEQRTLAVEAGGEAETHLQQAIELNNRFAPAYAELARLWSRSAEKLKEALGLVRRAIVLEPSRVGFHLMAASILLNSGQFSEAIKTAERARGLSKTPEQRASVDSILEHARACQQQEEARLAAERPQQELEEQEKDFRQTTAELQGEPQATQESRTMGGVRTAAVGRVVTVSCFGPRLNLSLQLPTHALELHTRDYSRIPFLAIHWTPPKHFNPCEHLQGRRVRISYIAGGTSAGEIVSIEIGE